MNGYLLIDKPAGWTSFDVVAKVRNILRQEYCKQLKVGHAGTLDPFATGLLIVLIGNATKQQDQFMKQDKTYEATMRLGQVSSTGDPEGEILDVSSVQPSQEAIQRTCASFIGQIDQIPPQFSAIKVDGKRAYDLARQGMDVVLPPRKVTIYELVLIDYLYPSVGFRTKVSSGTYIRTLAEDMGGKLQTGAYLTALRRTQIGAYTVADAVQMDDKLTAAVIQQSAMSVG